MSLLWLPDLTPGIMESKSFEQGYKYICLDLASNVHYSYVFYIFAVAVFSAVEHI